MTTPELLYRTLKGEPMPSGAERCFWCGAPCPPEHRTKDRVSDTFNGYSAVRAPSSGYVCAGCVLATDESDCARRPRLASWILSKTAERLGWSDLARIRTACLVPPEPPYAIVLALSGQKHLLYRTPVNRSRDVVTVQLELQAVTYRPSDLMDRLELSTAIAAAAGKPALTEPPRATMTTALYEYYENPEPYLRWAEVWAEPLSRLAAHFTPKKELCQNEYPSDKRAEPTPATPADRRGRVSANAGQPDGPGLFGGG